MFCSDSLNSDPLNKIFLRVRTILAQVDHCFLKGGNRPANYQHENHVTEGSSALNSNFLKIYLFFEPRWVFLKNLYLAKPIKSWWPQPFGDMAPVPLSIFRSNSKFDENSKHSSVRYTRPITTIFCTHHDSVTVVTCAKYRCDRSYTFYTRVFWIFIEFRIRSKYA